MDTMASPLLTSRRGMEEGHDHTLAFLKLSKKQNTTPRRKVGNWPWPIHLPLLGSGGEVAMATLPYLPEGKWERP